jgi:hypothetical protein
MSNMEAARHLGQRRGGARAVPVYPATTVRKTWLGMPVQVLTTRPTPSLPLDPGTLRHSWLLTR